MTPREKESIIVLSKYLAMCKDDINKFDIMRNYLHMKISSLLESNNKSRLPAIKS